VRKDLVEALQTDSLDLERLAEEFDHIFGNFKIISFYESKPTTSLLKQQVSQDDF